MPDDPEGSSELSDPPSSSEEERDENAPPRRRRGPSSRKLRKAREKKQKAAAAAAKQVPKPALPVALYFLDYCRAHPGPTKDLEKDEQKIKEKRRIAAKVILDGIADNTFPDKHDIRLREAGVNLG
ncbi:uncharacterized protein FFUJ_05882 [Fusarium fujikuroi IMI 58289]|uniref:Uncharacterized protein n=1 Tax=Gibberella fujikuroi (strain CBS 195.34 / IMI 58289 / NRRL A-6831) TaxID=1279085 RepID=S0E5I0_GIBF5|nr:uncharacterized protein FFUJ_05882 [Fusarium fujikuroi IMI 58289]CCT69955.1 uncharacterized protein FFUJ_05882 [Fusarium fujikuroi IMI 58289]